MEICDELIVMSTNSDKKKHSRVANSFALVVLAPERGGGGVTVVALRCEIHGGELVDRGAATRS